MPRRDDLNVEVPLLGSANQDDIEDNIVGRHQELTMKEYANKSTNWVHTTLILMLIVSVAGIVYWGNDFKQDQEQRELLAEATEERIAELEQLLADYQDQAKKSGQTLQQRLDEQKNQVTSQKKLMDTQYLEYQSKFAQLLKTANIKQAEQLNVFNLEIEKIEQKVKNAQEDAQEEMGFMTSQQKTALSGLEDRLTEIDSLRTSVTNLEISQTKNQSAQKDIFASLSVFSSETAELNEKLQLEMSDIKKNATRLDEQIEAYKVNADKSVSLLSSKVSVIARKATPKLDNAVKSRLAKTESAIKAIDGSRAQVNKEIQRLKGKVNKIQLQLQ
jgi:chromosome segregation ATPase